MRSFQRFIAPIFFVLIILICSSAVYAERFGNIAVFTDKKVDIDLTGVKARLEGSRIDNSFDKSGAAILWNLYPGGKDLQIVFPDDRKNISLFVVVYPGLTSKVNLTRDGEVLKLASDGFADQSGHVIVFDRETINALPGELNDGIGTLSGNYIDSAKYSYDGLSLTENSLGRSFGLLEKNYFDYAMINFSDPFAGYDGADISMISNFEGPDMIGIEGINGSRDQKRYRISAARALPRNVGSFFGALSYDDLGDAAPRWNVDDILPHNNAENIELLAGAGLNINSRIKSDIRILYKRNQRNYYAHEYYFNIEHAPREEIDYYNGTASINGWLTDRLFTRASFGISGYDQKVGDGVYFDNLEGYLRPGGNPLFDDSGLFYSWDDIDLVTPDIDEAHVYGDYQRTKTNAKRFEFNGLYKADTRLAAFLNIRYKMENYRYYRNLFPTIPENSVLVNIGFDSTGVYEFNTNGLDDLPNPKTLTMTFGGKYVSDIFSATASVNLLSFSSGAKTFIDLINPLGSDGGLDESDLINASTKTKIGYKVGVSVRALDISSEQNMTFYFNINKQYKAPELSALFIDYDFSDALITNYGFYYPLGNPDLDLYEQTMFGVGGIYKDYNHRLDLSLGFYRQDTGVVISNVPANPKSYQIYSNQQNFDYTIFRATYSYIGRSFLNAIISGDMFDDDNKRLSGTLIVKPKYLLSGVNDLLARIFTRTELSSMVNYKSGKNYTPYDKNADPITLYSVSNTPIGAYNSAKADDYFDVNVGLSISIIENQNIIGKIKFEVLNLLDRENIVEVYNTTGEPDFTGWLSSDQGQDWLGNQSEIDSSGMTRLEKYLLRQNDPNNFSRPRIFRISASVMF